MCVTIAKWRGISMQYCQDSNKYIVTVKSTSKEYDNPLEAWSTYLTLIDIAGRRYIGNMLDKQGKNRYTGEISKLWKMTVINIGYVKNVLTNGMWAYLLKTLSAIYAHVAIRNWKEARKTGKFKYFRKNICLKIKKKVAKKKATKLEKKMNKLAAKADKICRNRYDFEILANKIFDKRDYRIYMSKFKPCSYKFDE